jgi:hypothetical protein
LIVDIKTLEQSIVMIQKECLPTFPLSYADTDKAVDLEHALFCVSLSKHGHSGVKGMSGSPLNIAPISKIKTLFTIQVSISKHPNSNIFFRYSFGERKLPLHSLRHFANTQAEKGGIPLGVIAAWSGRKNINRRLNMFIHQKRKNQKD